MTDWTDRTLRPLDELARLAFPPEAGVTADTLKRRARQGKLTVYRPGKAYLSTLADVWQMMQVLRVGAIPSEGTTETELANLGLDRLLRGFAETRKAARRPPVIKRKKNDD